MPNNQKIVGIGASAGGLRALESFFHAVEDGTGFSYVVIQHLSPDFKSLMGELLGRHTKMSISSAQNGETILPNHVYLIPPRKILKINNGRLCLEDSNGTPSLPVDVFFNSLAEGLGEKATGIILSGTGSDGMKGCQQIKAKGGKVFVQDPESAEFDGMPRSVILSRAYDHVLRPDQMPQALANPNFEGDSHSKAIATNNEGIYLIAESLKRSYGLDIQNYKNSTVFRRIQRQIEKNKSASIIEYGELLSENAEKLDDLYRDLLIGVSSFFRDDYLWVKLEKETIPALFAQAKPSELRAWVAGCATGEEVYSLAILLTEEGKKIGYKGAIKIFATDLHQGSLASASEGIYPAEAVEAVPEKWRNKYFTQKNNTYYVSDILRSQVVFASHNLLADPPFTRLDLVTCRNLLIYLEPSAQERAISMLLYGLREGGSLALGASENADNTKFGIDNLDSHARIYRKRKNVPIIGLPSSLSSQATRPLMRKWDSNKGITINPQLLNDYDTIISTQVGDGFIIDENQQVLHYVGDPNPYLKPASGRVATSLLDQLSGDLHLALSTCLQRVRSKESPFTMRGVRDRDADDRSLVDLRVDPLPAKEQESHYFVSVKRTSELPAASDANKEVPTSESGESYNPSQSLSTRIAELELELQASRENMQAAIEQAQMSNEELQAANEELLASNEELQSTNEELHSVNEELFSVNSEFELKNYELQNLNEDYDRLLSSLVDIGIVYLDEDLRIRKYNDAITSIFSLLPEDIGRPLGDIAYSLGNHKKFLRRVGKVLEQEEPISFETKTHEGKSLMVRMFPFNRERQVTSGVIVTFTDITEVKKAQNRLEMAVNVSHLVWWDWDLDQDQLLTYSASERSFECILGYDEVSIPKTFKGWLDATHPEDAERVHRSLQDHLDGKTPRWISEHRYQAHDGAWVWVKDLGEVIVRDNDGKPIKMVGTTQNIHNQKLLELGLRDKCDENEILLQQAEEVTSELKELAEKAQAANKAKSEFLAMMSHEIRTPLNAILGYSQLLLDSEIDEKVRQSLEPVNYAGESLLAIIGDILDFSKLEAHSVDLEKSPVCLQDLLMQASKSVPPKDKVTFLEKIVDEQRNPVSDQIWLLGDPTRLSQILTNLIGNAV
ncbi:MAG: chemotaxis protein CheB, partial [Verrucomicrobiota bacterium]